MRFDVHKFHKKIVLLCISAAMIFLMTGFIIAFPFSQSKKGKIDGVNYVNTGTIIIDDKIIDHDESKEDNKEKDLLMNSSKTDFSEPSAEKHASIFTHVLQEGESLSDVSKKFGVSIGSICGSSGLTSYEGISPGTKLTIPSKDGIVYKIKKKESLINISARYKISVNKILKENPALNPDFLSEGSTIFIPDARPLNMLTGFLWPVAARVITSNFGMRIHPITGEYLMHTGIDISANYEWVKATRYGKVTYAGWLSGYGRVVIIAHPEGFKSLYGHLSKITVNEDQYVKQGQIIARTGNTGISTGPHLHFEIQKNGATVNPRKFVK